MLPLGATEQHGPHLPLATDTIVAEAWARAAAGRVEGVAVAPALPYGSSGEHQDFPGTVSIGREGVRLMVMEIARSVRGDYEALVFVSGHGGNAPALRPAVDQLRNEGHTVDLAEPRWEPAGAWAPGAPDRMDAHAGFVETSLMLFLRPDLVRPFSEVTGNTTPIAELIPTLLARGVAAVSDSGVLGDPSGASREIGELLFNHLVDGMVAALERLRHHKMRS